MNVLDLSRINLISPYTVWNTTERYYFFKTDHGAVYKIGFMDDFSIWETGAYQFLIIIAEFDETIRILTNKPGHIHLQRTAGDGEVTLA